MRGSGYRRGYLSRMGGMVNNSLEDLGVRHKVLEHQTMAKWKQVVGPHIAVATVVEKISDGILFVCCKSSAWAQECTFHKQRIMKELNKSAGRPVIKDIRFSSRGFKKAQEEAAKRQTIEPPPTKLDSIELGAVETEMAERVASISPSEELAAKIRSTIMTSKRLEKVRLEEGWKRCPRCQCIHTGKSDICVKCR